MDDRDIYSVIKKLNDVQVEVKDKTSGLKNIGMFTHVVEPYCVLQVGTGLYELYQYNQIESVTILFD